MLACFEEYSNPPPTLYVAAYVSYLQISYKIKTHMLYNEILGSYKECKVVFVCRHKITNEDITTIEKCHMLINGFRKGQHDSHPHQCL